ncbi:hypothetical protein Anas_08264 [Armadillidium nasatum]|uniref:O-acyltransferase WSD1 C-terminal domain-containing protein n=1 Tax=Armadillidium nasatum TaxID=96803 RepID=A0A5N5SSE0_9CRUS|nr:hypothetical protein Anas_08264 [Armadillidium nasatum]
MSNLAGPDREGFKIMGCPKNDFCFFIPDRSPMGMGISFAGFNGSIRVGLMIDRSLMATEEEASLEFLQY